MRKHAGDERGNAWTGRRDGEEIDAGEQTQGGKRHGAPIGREKR
jgi:hypothetical protein